MVCVRVRVRVRVMALQLCPLRMLNAASFHFAIVVPVDVYTRGLLRL